MKSKRTSALRHAFTLIELLTVIAIIGILAAILIPTLGSVRGSAQRSTCISNLRQFYNASMLYGSDYRGYLPNPEAKSSFPNGVGVGASWLAEIRPYMGLPENASKYVKGQFDCPTNARRFADNGNKWSDPIYGMNYSLGYCTSPSNKVRRTLASLPAPARTLMFSEGGHSGTGGAAVATLSPSYLQKSVEFGNVSLKGVHKGQNNVLWCDGHVSAMDVPTLTANGDAYLGESSLYWTPGFKAE